MNSTVESTLPIFFELIKERKITAKQVSDATGIPQTTMASWRKGVRKPKIEALESIAKYLGVTVDYLLGKRSEDPETDELIFDIKRLDADRKEIVRNFVDFQLEEMARESEQKKVSTIEQQVAELLDVLKTSPVNNPIFTDEQLKAISEYVEMVSENRKFND